MGTTTNNTYGSSYGRYPSQSYGFDFSLDESQAALDFRHLFYTIWRRKLLILTIFLTAIFLTWLHVNTTTPTYKATSTIRLEDNKIRIVDVASIITPRVINDARVLSEVEVIKSRTIARQVVDRLNLALEGSVQPTSTPSEPLTSFSGRIVRGLHRILGMDASPQSTLPGQAPSARQKAIDQLMARLSVEPVARAHVIAISYNSADPERAALIANAVAEQYIENQLLEKLETTQRAEDWMRDRLTTLRQNLMQAEEELEKYRESLLYTKGQQHEIIDQQLSQLTSEVIRSKAEYASVKARIQQMQEFADTNMAEIPFVDVLKLDLITNLKMMELRLKRERSEASKRYGPKHPRMISLNTQIEEIRDSIRSQVQVVLSSLKGESRAAKAKVEELEANLLKLQKDKLSSSAALIRLRELEREAEINRVLYKNFLERFKSASQSEKLLKADASILSEAQTPKSPAAPRKNLLITAAGIISLIIGLLAAFVVSVLDPRFRSISNVSKLTGVPVLGMIPRASKLDTKTQANYVLRRPFSAIAESVRMVQTSLNLIRGGHPNTVINVTSSKQGEGKTTFCVWFARMAAMSGKRVILLDCDIRQPRLHKLFPGVTGMSLDELLSGKNTLNSEGEGTPNIAVDERTRMHMVFGRDSSAKTLDLMDSGRMRSLIKVLRKQYDLVVIDSPPSLRVSDALVLAGLADTTVYLAKYDDVSRDAVVAGMREFREFGLDVAGIVLTHIKTDKGGGYYRAGKAYG